MEETELQRAKALHNNLIMRVRNERLCVSESLFQAAVRIDIARCIGLVNGKLIMTAPLFQLYQHICGLAGGLEGVIPFWVEDTRESLPYLLNEERVPPDSLWILEKTGTPAASALATDVRELLSLVETLSRQIVSSYDYRLHR